MSIHQSVASGHSGRSSARTFVRRLYFYGMALISLIAAVIAIDNLLRTLDEIWFGSRINYAIDGYTRDAIAGSGGVLLVAAPIFLLHWAFILRRRDPEELQSGMRKFFIYVASAVAIGFAIVNLYDLLQGIAHLAVGMPLSESIIWPDGWLHHLLMYVVAMLLQLYLFNIAAKDGDLGQEIGLAGTWRRLYQTAAGLFGLALTIVASVQLVDTLLRLLLGAAGLNLSVSWWRSLVGDSIAQLILGALILRTNWVRWQALSHKYPQERQSALRRFYLYVAVVMGALTVLIPISELLRALLLVLFRYEYLSDTTVQDVLATTMAAAPIGLYVWRWHWKFLQTEADSYGESSQGATIRRLYYYAVAMTGLVLVWFGAIDLVQVAIDWATGSTVVAGDRLWAMPLAAGLSRLLIAAPIWAFHWQVVQRIATRDDAEGRVERASGPRRVYLYGVALAGGLVILYYLAQVVYRVLLVILGDTSVSFVGAGPAGDLARCLIAAAIWTLHVMAIRRDSQMGSEAVEADAPQAIDIDEQRAILEARINLLEIQLREAREALAALPAHKPVHSPGNNPEGNIAE